MKISIIMASYNYADYIKEAIESVINQSYQNWELIIVDDGSLDSSVDIIKSYCQIDKRIKLFKHKNDQNRGLRETILLGLKHAKGEWIAFLESDDSFLPDNLNEKVKLLQKYNEIGLIFNKVEFITPDDTSPVRLKILEGNQDKLSKMKFPKNLFYELYERNFITTFSCVMVKKDLLEKANFDTPFDSLLDWWLWIHLSYNNKFYYIDIPLTYWRLHSKSYTSKIKNPVFNNIQFMAYKNIYKNYRGIKIMFFIFFSIFKSILNRVYILLLKVNYKLCK